MKAIRYLFPLAALLCFVEVILPDATAQQTEELRREFQSTKAKAEKGDADAQFTLGVMYAKGNGVAKDPAQAVTWYRTAADHGNAPAQFNLGVMYATGDVVEKDYAEAVKWYRKAADQGNADAQFNLGVMYAKGNGVTKDEIEAVKWYRKAADQGHAVAQFTLGVMYAKGYGVAKDETEAVKWYRKAADQGNAIAQFRLESIDENGNSVAKGKTESVNLWRDSTGLRNLLLVAGLVLIFTSIPLLMMKFKAPIPPLQDSKKQERNERERKEQERKEQERERQNRTVVFDCISCGSGIRLRLHGAVVHRCPSCKIEYKTIQAAGEPTVLLVVPASIHQGKSSEKKSQQKRAMPPDIRSALVALGLSEEASFEDVRGAYREHVKQYHPDKVAHLGADLRKLAETKTKEFNAAYAKLEKFYASA